MRDIPEREPDITTGMSLIELYRRWHRPTVHDEIKRWSLDRQADVFIALLRRALYRSDEDGLPFGWMMKELMRQAGQAGAIYSVRDPLRHAIGFIGRLGPEKYLEMKRLLDDSPQPPPENDSIRKGWF